MAEWSNMHERSVPQIEFARFLEERAHEIVAPDAATVIETAMSFEALRRVDFKSAVRLSNGTREFVYVEEDQAKGKVVMPERLSFAVPIFDEMEKQTVSARIRYRLDEGRLFFSIVFDDLSEIERDAFQVCVSVFEDALRGEIPVWPVIF